MSKTNTTAYPEYIARHGTLPFRLFFRRGHVRELFGFSEQQMTKLVRAGTLKPVHLKGDKQAYFDRRDLLKLVEGAEQSTQATQETKQLVNGR